MEKAATLAQRWRMQYVDGLIREDVLDFEKFSDFKSLKLCLELLRSRVGSPVSYASIARDIGIAPNTVKKYIQVFEEHSTFWKQNFPIQISVKTSIIFIPATIFPAYN